MIDNLMCKEMEKGKGNKVACGCQHAGLDMFFDPAHRLSDFHLFLQRVLSVQECLHHTYVISDTISI